MAPKKKKNTKSPNNGYFYLLMELRNKMDHSQADKEAARMWPLMSAAEKEPYNMRGRQSRASNFKMTTTQENLEYVVKAEEEEKLKDQYMQDDIKSHIRYLAESQSVTQEYFHIMHINNFFVTTTNEYFPAEIALVRFNLEDGVKEENVYHSRIRPGKFPPGYMGTAKIASDDTHKLPYSNMDLNCNMKGVCKDIFEFLTESAVLCRDPSKLPAIYVKDDFCKMVSDVLNQMAYTYHFDAEQLRVYSLSFLLYTLRNDISNTNVWPSISQSINELDRDVFDYTREIPCQFHKETDSPLHCSRSHAIRMAFILCDNCCTDLGIQLIPGQHVPLDANVDVDQSCAVSDATFRTPAESYANSLSHSYRTTIDSLPFDDNCTITTNDDQIDQEVEWCEVRSRSVRSSETSDSRTISSQQTSRRPKTDWRETAFAQTLQGNFKK